MQIMESPVPGHIMCKSCAEIDPGYYTLPTKQCGGIGYCQQKLEICGDGINLGLLECDDGNNINGDGCSADCRIEKGFKCYKRTKKADLCVDVLPPKAELKVKKGNMLEIRFSEFVKSTLNSIPCFDNPLFLRHKAGRISCYYA